MEKCILFGNGINRVLSKATTWKDVLLELATEYKIDCTALIDSGQYTMVYEQIIGSQKVNELDIKKRIAGHLSNSERSASYSHLSRIGVTSFLTTNYEHHLENELRENYFITHNDESEAIYSVRRKVELDNSQKPVEIWNIHGSIREAKSIMLGFDHYCGYIGKINSYVKGFYSYGEHATKMKVESIQNKLLKSDGARFDSTSWIEHFFKSNVYIIGLGMSYSEIDLWWILNKRARMKNSENMENIITNKIIYFGDNDVAKIQLLNSFGVRTVTRNESEKHDDFFMRTINEINKDNS